jgi:hypothetical protein
MGDGIGVRMYLTNICDPHMLSLGDIAQLYVRRWDIELAFRLLKEYLGMSHWWSSKQELILMQIWVVLILSHLVYALRERIALAADCDPFEVSVPLLVDLLPQLCPRVAQRDAKEKEEGFADTFNPLACSPIGEKHFPRKQR